MIYYKQTGWAAHDKCVAKVLEDGLFVELV